MIEFDAMQYGVFIGMLFGFLGGFAAAMAVIEGRAILADAGRRARHNDGGKRGRNLTKTDRVFRRSQATKVGDAHAR